MTTLYIAGPMTGIEDFNRPAFFTAERTLKAAGFEILNPARHQQDGRSWADYMRVDIVDLLKADGVAVLPDWGASKGASLEVHIALTLGVPVKRVDVWAVHGAVAA